MRRHQLDASSCKTPEQIEKMRAAGLVVAAALGRDARRGRARRLHRRPRRDRRGGDPRRRRGARRSRATTAIPATICSSVNEQVVHAIPSPRQVLRDGDLISIDCGAILDGWHGDAAITVPRRRGATRR